MRCSKARFAIRRISSALRASRIRPEVASVEAMHEQRIVMQRLQFGNQAVLPVLAAGGNREQASRLVGDDQGIVHKENDRRGAPRDARCKSPSCIKNPARRQTKRGTVQQDGMTFAIPFPILRRGVTPHGANLGGRHGRSIPGRDPGLYGQLQAPPDGLCARAINAHRRKRCAVFAIGTTYGGDGQNTFALPNLAGSIPIHQGAGPGLTPRSMGRSRRQRACHPEHPATTNPHPHRHPLRQCRRRQGQPGRQLLGRPDPGGNSGGYSTTAGSQMAGTAIGPAGRTTFSDNLQPFLVIKGADNPMTTCNPFW